MAIRLPEDMNKLLDNIITDLETKKVNLYSVLDTPEFNEFYDYEEEIGFKDFISSVIIFLDINYSHTNYKHLFLAVIDDIFGPIEDWENISPVEFEIKKEMMMEGISEITYQELPYGHIDYDMVYVMLEKQIEDD